MKFALDLLSYNKSELEKLVAELGEPRYRAGQIFSWLHLRRVSDFSQMTDLSAALRQKLSDRAYICRPKPLREQRSADGTVKFLFGLEDGNCIETVAMSYEHGISLCVSSQVGCRMGCRFCASAKGGLVRNLAASEILGQVYRAGELLNGRIDSVVLMGQGEPLDNFENVLRFVELVSAPDGYNLSNRAISLSTCGLVPRIRELADMRLQLTLSVSLHAADDVRRSSIMPVNDAYHIGELLDACDYYFKQTGRRISYEYAVIDGVNDSRECAQGLACLLKGKCAHINLIPVNSGGEFVSSGREAAKRFCALLVGLGLNATVRRTLGADIDAACGQLRNKYLGKEIRNDSQRRD